MRQENPSPPAPLPQAQGRELSRSRVGCAVRTKSAAIAGVQGPGGPATSCVGYMPSPDEIREAGVEHSPDFIRTTVLYCVEIVGSMQRFDPQAVGAAGLAEGFAGGDHHGFATLGQALSLGRFPGRCW